MLGLDCTVPSGEVVGTNFESFDHEAHCNQARRDNLTAHQDNQGAGVDNSNLQAPAEDRWLLPVDTVGWASLDLVGEDTGPDSSLVGPSLGGHTSENRLDSLDIGHQGPFVHPSFEKLVDTDLAAGASVGLNSLAVLGLRNQDTGLDWVPSLDTDDTGHCIRLASAFVVELPAADDTVVADAGDIAVAPMTCPVVGKVAVVVAAAAA